MLFVIEERWHLWSIRWRVCCDWWQMLLHWLLLLLSCWITHAELALHSGVQCRWPVLNVQLYCLSLTASHVTLLHLIAPHHLPLTTDAVQHPPLMLLMLHYRRTLRSCIFPVTILDTVLQHLSDDFETNIIGLVYYVVRCTCLWLKYIVGLYENVAYGCLYWC